MLKILGLHNQYWYRMKAEGSFIIRLFVASFARKIIYCLVNSVQSSLCFRMCLVWKKHTLHFSSQTNCMTCSSGFEWTCPCPLIKHRYLKISKVCTYRQESTWTCLQKKLFRENNWNLKGEYALLLHSWSRLNIIKCCYSSFNGKKQKYKMFCSHHVGDQWQTPITANTSATCLVFDLYCPGNIYSPLSQI